MAHVCRQQSHLAASSSNRVQLHTKNFFFRAVRARSVRLVVVAKVQTLPKVVYIPAFLHQADFATVQQEARALQSKLRPELNCIATGRLGCYLPATSSSTTIFSSRQVTQAVTQRVRSQFPLFMSDFPVELRQYPKGSDMPWHRDEQLYARPQWELIFTVDNTSDSWTQWRDEAGQEHSIWTEPNSLLAVEAEGWDHQVLPVKRGLRTILKMAYTCTKVKLPAFAENLDREAY